MTESSEPVSYCLACGAESPPENRFCRDCGASLDATPRQRLRGSAYFLNELHALRDEGVIDDSVYERLRSRYRLTLSELGPQVTPRRPAPAPRRAAPKKEGPGWLAEQQANLLLYLGAFLVVIATLVFVASGPEVSDALKMALLVLGTLLFLAVGLACANIPRVRQAGTAFFAVGALMVPLIFVGAYAFYFQDEELDATGLWLAASLTSVLFYGAVSTLGMGRWYPVPMVFAMLSALGAALALGDAPPEAYSPSYVALAGLLLLPSVLPMPRAKDVFGSIPLLAANAVVPLAVLGAFSITGFEDDRDFELITRWYLPATVALAALFYWAQALRPERADTQPALTIIALSVTAALATTVVYALNVGEQWYGPAVAIVGLLYAGGSERFGPPWFGRAYLGWMALGLLTASWLLFEGLYGDFARHGAGVHFGAAICYLAAARIVAPEVRLSAAAASATGATGAQPVTIPAAVMLVYAAGLTGGLGYFFLLSSLPAAETAAASDLSMAFFGLSLGVAAVTATMRWWWRDMRVHFYAIALAMSLFVLLSSVDAEGQVLVFLAVYTAVGLALVFWERQPLALSIPGALGFFALAALWRHYALEDAYLPLVLSSVGYGLFAAHVIIRDRERDWAHAGLGIAFAFAVLAPIAGWVRLSVLADEAGFIGTQSFEETALYQTAAASVLMLALLLAAQAWLARRWDIAAGASALMMVALLLEIGHFRPENVQAYTVPLGAYVLAGAFVLHRVRAVPADLKALLPQIEVLGALLIMGPTLVQSFEDGAWAYGLLLLGESLAFVGLALVLRRIWLLSTSVSFVVLNGVHYLFVVGGPPLPNWAILAIAGVAVMAAGTAILFGRERWTEWQRVLQVWWDREEPVSEAG
ncbi:MAG: zinc ribbon domain-containing protein [Chloroflexi bacterium]|nr:zinc ribbon domain-containing protein [Chloroflexota bacterium]